MLHRGAIPGLHLTRWRHAIAAWHQSYVSNGPTEAIHNLVKRDKQRRILCRPGFTGGGNGVPGRIPRGVGVQAGDYAIKQAFALGRGKPKNLGLKGLQWDTHGIPRSWLLAE